MEPVVGRVLRSQSGHVRVRTERALLACRMRGRLKQGKARTDLVVIGDLVEVTEIEGSPGEGIIERVRPRRNRFARRQPGSRGRYKEDVLVANLDWIVAVFACGQPPPKAFLIDRFLVLAELDDIPVALAANKVDQVGLPEARRRFGPYEELGYPVHYTSARDGVGLDALRARLADGVSAFVGPSGEGKSSLLNALDDSLALRVADISEALAKGRHTTRVAELHPLAGGGWLADTPGIRELAGFRIPPEILADGFPEMRPYLGACRFSDCLHVEEPGCAVRRAVDDGAIRPARYESYLRQLRDDER
ncbi:MAG: ribosome small subunit-dependent GTPase A [Sandaracinaceae bacterium]